MRVSNQVLSTDYKQSFGKLKPRLSWFWRAEEREALQQAHRQVPGISKACDVIIYKQDGNFFVMVTNVVKGVMRNLEHYTGAEPRGTDDFYPNTKFPLQLADQFTQSISKAYGEYAKARSNY